MKKAVKGPTIAPYSPAVVFDNRLVFVSGQLPENTALSITEQTKSSLQRLKDVLEQSGASLETVLKTTVFLTDLKDFQEMNDIYKTFFTTEHPARSTVQVAALPTGAKLEIEAIAYVAAQ